jgi:antitoxin component YwqK of YwqJK toxin-antitoxin module
LIYDGNHEQGFKSGSGKEFTDRGS